MFLITYKKGLNSEKSKIKFDHPLTFLKANEMLIEAVTRYKQSGQMMKVSYKIIEIETGESIFNSKILIDRDIPSLYHLIKENSNTPKLVLDYVLKVEKREIIEEEGLLSSDNHLEEKARLEELKSEKNEILQQLKKEEKERQQRDIEHQQRMKEIQAEKEALEKALKLKEKEEAVKESQRIEALRLLEEEKIKAVQLMEEKRNLDKKKKEEHEERLKQVENEAKKAEIELASIETELKVNELERKKELQELEDKKLESDRKASILKAEGDKEEVKYHQELIEIQKRVVSEPPHRENNLTTAVLPKPTLKEQLQELDFEEVKGRSIQFVKFSVKGSVNGSKKAYKLLKNYHEKRLNQKQEKLNILNNQAAIEEKINLEKMKFLEELNKDRLNQEKKLKKEVKQKEKELLRQSKIEARYRAAKKRKMGRSPIIGGGTFKYIFGTFTFILVGMCSIYYFNLGDTFPVLSGVESNVGNILTKIMNAIQKS
ncbi:hypothetical protein [Bacillus massiliglaciei]|uniref:hypothetical protein n=1 Tax=Bacillus massiliglaciei TaxID=1816693 RepID=UPI000DA5ECF0|nr:hypothetical protein [Bacillus massiliglaciei]